MNGPEHYREAERLLERLEDSAAYDTPEWHANQLTRAQVHATLAVAAGINPGLQYVVHITDNPSDPWRTTTPDGARVDPR